MKKLAVKQYQFEFFTPEEKLPIGDGPILAYGIWPISGKNFWAIVSGVYYDSDHQCYKAKDYVNNLWYVGIEAWTYLPLLFFRKEITKKDPARVWDIVVKLEVSDSKLCMIRVDNAAKYDKEIREINGVESTVCVTEVNAIHVYLDPRYDRALVLERVVEYLKTISTNILLS